MTNAPTNEPLDIQSARNKLTEIHLGAQRILVLWVLRIYQSLGLYGATQHIRFFLEPDKVPTAQVLPELSAFERAQRSPLVQVAFGIHNIFDRFRSLKNKGIELTLWLHALRSVVLPGWRYSGFREWRKKDLLLRAEHLALQKARVAQWPHIAVLLRGEPQHQEAMRASVERTQYPHLTFINKLADISNEQLLVCLSDATLHNDSLWWLALSFLNSKWATFYADSEATDFWGRPANPEFHPDFTLEYFILKNPAGPLAAVNLAKIHPDLQGTALKLTTFERLLFSTLNNGLCHHERKILSCKLNPSKTYAFDRAAAEFIAASKPGLQLNLQAATLDQRLRVIPPKEWPLVSILIPTKDRLDLLLPLIDGLRFKTDYPRFEVLIINNNSSQSETFKFFADIQKADDRIRVVDFLEPYNFSRINNFGLTQVSGSVLALMNNDVEVMHPDWLQNMVALALQPDTGAVGAKLYFANKSIQHAGVVLGIGQVAGHIHTFESRKSRGYLDRLTFTHEFSAVTCACFILRRDVFINSGLFSDDLAVAYNDIDFCLKIKKAGYRILWTPRAELIHKESSTRPPDRRPDQLARYRMEVDIMRTRWMSYIQNDPFYNPQLTRDKSDLSLNWNFDWYKNTETHL